MTAVIVVGVVIAFGVLVFWLERRRRRPAGDVFLRINCPACRQRLKFPQRQVGQPAACPRCKKLFAVPGKHLQPRMP